MSLHPFDAEMIAADELDRHVRKLLVRVQCTRCGAAVAALVAVGFGWEVDAYGRPGAGHGCDARICNLCVDRLVDPLRVDRHDWFAADGEWYVGQEAYESQFAGACTLLARFAPGTRLAQMRLPDTGGDDWRIERDDPTEVVARAECF